MVVTDPVNDHTNIPLRMGESYLRLKMDGRFFLRLLVSTDQVLQSSQDTPEAKGPQDLPIAQVTQDTAEAQPAQGSQGSQAGPSHQNAQETQISQQTQGKRDTQGTQDVQGGQDTQGPQVTQDTQEAQVPQDAQATQIQQDNQTTFELGDPQDAKGIQDFWFVLKFIDATMKQGQRQSFRSCRLACLVALSMSTSTDLL